MNEALEMASESEGALRSELIRRALRHYIRQNPDQLEVFNKEQKADRSRKVDSQSQQSDTNENNVYNPMEGF